MDDELPVTGAWRPGDPLGGRTLVPVRPGRPFHLEGGGVLHGVEAAYETWGELDERAGNAVLVCHALTGDSHAAGRITTGHPTPGWWDPLIGPGRAIDTDRWFVVCVNVLGGCQGSTGPASTDPATGKPYGSTFPVVTIRDMVRAQAAVADHLGIRRWRCVAGGSMGGMQVLEWAAVYPDRVGAIAVYSATAAASAQQVAWSSVGRQAVALDPGFDGGDYYDNPPGQGPHRGLALARQIAQITYRGEAVYSQRFGRDLVDPLDGFELWQRFQVESYLDHHGRKLARRFDANSYLRLNKAMDLHDLGRGRGPVERVLARLVVPSLVGAVTSDTLYPPYQQEELHRGLAASGAPAGFQLIDSPQGHDGFLIETQAVGGRLREFLEQVADPSTPPHGRTAR